jgi:hypothetical protein
MMALEATGVLQAGRGNYGYPLAIHDTTGQFPG